MKRHTCKKCGAKRSEKFMKKISDEGWRKRFEWICDDQYCGRAWEKQYGI